MKYLISIFVAATLLITGVDNASASNKLIRNSTLVLEDILVTRDSPLPAKLLGNAKGILIFPALLKGGFYFGAQFGTGVASVRDSSTGKWGAPVFLSTLGTSFGFQIGAESVDLVLLIMSEKGMDGLMKGQFQVGGEIGMALGPLGRHAEAKTDILFKSEVYAYSKSKGLYGGVAVNGSAFSFEEQAIEKYYGKAYTPAELFSSNIPAELPESGRRFISRLNSIAPPPYTPKDYIQPRKGRK